MTIPIRPSAKDAIIDAAFQILSGNPGASLSEIADRAGVGRATLHRHFAHRHDLIRTLGMIAIEEMEGVVDVACKTAESYSEALRLALTALIPLGDRYGFLAHEPIDDDPEFRATYQRQLDETRDMVEEAKREGAFDKSVSTIWIANAFEHLLYAAWESVKAGHNTHDQAADLAWRTLTNGLGKAKK